MFLGKLGPRFLEYQVSKSVLIPSFLLTQWGFVAKRVIKSIVFENWISHLFQGLIALKNLSKRSVKSFIILFHIGITFSLYN